MEVYPGIDQEAEAIVDAREKQIYKDKVGVVTGATGAIGQALTEQLARMGMTVVMCSRDPEKAQQLAVKISKKTGNKNIKLQKLDLTDQDSIVKAVSEIKDNYDGIDLLVNGAGVTPAESKERDISMEEWIGINYLGPTIFTLGLVDHLRTDGQVITLTSSSQMGDKDNFADGIFPEKSKDPYKGAKLLLETVTHRLDEILSKDEANRRIIAIDPGNVHKILRGRSVAARLSRSKRLKPLLSTPEEAALGIIRVILMDYSSSRYAYGKPSEFPKAVTDSEFLKTVASRTVDELNDSASDLIGARLGGLGVKV